MRHLTALAVISLLFLSSCEMESLDNGMMFRDGVYLYSNPPLGVYVDSEMDALIVDEAIDWWAEQAGREMFFRPTPTPDVTVFVGHIPSSEVVGLANIRFSRFDGLITSCDIILSSDYYGDRDYILGGVKHELGHCVGLDDDPFSRDVNSIMSNTLLPDGQLTERDRVLTDRL